MKFKIVQGKIDNLELCESILSGMKTFRELKIRPRKKMTGTRVLEIAMPDLHIGKFANEQETGEMYDIKIARERATSALSFFLNEAPAGVGEVLLSIGNDFFHVDSIQNETTNGTAQDVSDKWHSIFQAGIALAKDMINTLILKGYKVNVIMVPGNHDHSYNFFLGQVLAAYYDGEIEIDASPRARKYKLVHKVLIGYTHGSEEKLSSLGSIMASECKALWGQAKACEWRVGHLHTRETIEVNGVVIRRAGSLAGTDSWHAKKGYIAQRKSAEAYVIDAEFGVFMKLEFNPTS